MKDNALLKDMIFVCILLAIMFFFVKGVPALMGGAHDATGASIAISYVQTVDYQPIA